MLTVVVKLTTASNGRDITKNNKLISMFLKPFVFPYKVVKPYIVNPLFAGRLFDDQTKALIITITIAIALG